MRNQDKEIQECRDEIQRLQWRLNKVSSRVEALAGDAMRIQSERVVRQAECQQATMPKPQPKASSKYADLENKIGKNLFPILASLLILLGVGVFIASIYEHIPEFVKAVAIYAFGFALLGGGLLIYRRQENKFWLGVASCGLAELLVSIISSHSYFEILPLPAVFILILFWIAGSMYLTKFNPVVFKTIGYIGFHISIVLGLSLLAENEPLMFATLLAAYVALSVFFMMTNKEQKRMNSVMAIVGVAGLAYFIDMPAFLPASMSWLCGAVITVIAVGLHGIYLVWAKLSQKLYALLASMTMLTMTMFLTEYDLSYTMPILLTGLLMMWAVNENIEKDKTTSLVLTIVSAFLMLVTPEAGGDFDVWAVQGWYPAFIIAGYLLFWKAKGRGVAWVTIAAAAEFVIFAMDQNLCTHMIATAVPAAAVAAHMTGVVKKDEYLQTAWYALLFLLFHAFREDAAEMVLRAYDDWTYVYICDALFFAALAVIHTAYMHITFTDKEFFSKLTPIRVILLFLQAYIFVNCMALIDSALWPAVLLSIMASLVIISYSLWHTYKTRGENSKLLLWQFIKFSLYCWQVLAVLDSPGVIINISLLVIAIVAISIGFHLQAKAVRVYGLTLSLLDVVSLVLLNVDRSNPIRFSIGIVLCGGLCFAISFFYSRFPKK